MKGIKFIKKYISLRPQEIYSGWYKVDPPLAKRNIKCNQSLAKHSPCGSTNQAKQRMEIIKKKIEKKVTYHKVRWLCLLDIAIFLPTITSFKHA